MSGIEIPNSLINYILNAKSLIKENTDLNVFNRIEIINLLREYFYYSTNKEKLIFINFLIDYLNNNLIEN